MIKEHVQVTILVKLTNNRTACLIDRFLIASLFIKLPMAYENMDK
jgi:hypothetical protein